MEGIFLKAGQEGSAQREMLQCESPAVTNPSEALPMWILRWGFHLQSSRDSQDNPSDNSAFLGVKTKKQKGAFSMRSDAPLSWLTSESRLSVSGCWSIPLRANFLLLACLYNLIDSTQDIELRSSSLGWCAQASLTPHMTLPGIWNRLNNHPENQDKTGFWDVDSAAFISQSKPKARYRKRLATGTQRHTVYTNKCQFNAASPDHTNDKKTGQIRKYTWPLKTSPYLKGKPM